MLRDFRTTQIENRIYLFPVPVIKDRKYLIHCKNIEEANALARAILEKKLTHPDLNSDDFLFITLHTDKQTKIMALNPQIDLAKLKG